MTLDERILICQVTATISMWGHAWVGALLMESLDKKLPSEPTWQRLYAQYCKDAQREHVGIIADEKELQRKVQQGYWLTNWDEDGCALFNPPPMNGLHKYVARPLAEKYRP